MHNSFGSNRSHTLLLGLLLLAALLVGFFCWQQPLRTHRLGSEAKSQALWTSVPLVDVSVGKLAATQVDSFAANTDPHFSVFSESTAVVAHSDYPFAVKAVPAERFASCFLYFSSRDRIEMSEPFAGRHFAEFDRDVAALNSPRIKDVLIYRTPT